jgi:hypothetical protein
MFPCSSMGTVAGILQIESAHMSEANFSSHSETLNGSLTWWTSSRDIRGFAPFRAFERRYLRSSLAHGLIAGQSPMELGISSSSLSSINVPVLDSRIKQSRIVAKSYWLVRDQAVRQVQTNGARDSYLYLLSKIIISYGEVFSSTAGQVSVPCYCARTIHITVFPLHPSLIPHLCRIKSSTRITKTEIWVLIIYLSMVRRRRRIDSRCVEG